MSYFVKPTPNPAYEAHIRRQVEIKHEIVRAAGPCPTCGAELVQTMPMNSYVELLTCGEHVRRPITEQERAAAKRKVDTS